jgi:hypothetical protein
MYTFAGLAPHHFHMLGNLHQRIFFQPFEATMHPHQVQDFGLHSNVLE